MITSFLLLSCNKTDQEFKQNDNPERSSLTTINSNATYLISDERFVVMSKADNDISDPFSCYDITGSKSLNNIVTIKWKAAINRHGAYSHFVIQRADDFKTFVDIGWVPYDSMQLDYYTFTYNPRTASI